MVAPPGEVQRLATADGFFGRGVAIDGDRAAVGAVEVDEETGQTIISGMGELHLEIIADRLLREFSVHANVGAPSEHRWENLL